MNECNFCIFCVHSIPSDQTGIWKCSKYGKISEIKQECMKEISAVNKFYKLITKSNPIKE